MGIVEILVKALMAMAMRLVGALTSTLVLEWAFWKLAQMLVDHTETPHDNAFLVKLKEVYEGNGEETK